MRFALALFALVLVACGGEADFNEPSNLPVIYGGHPLVRPWTDQHGYSANFQDTGRIFESIPTGTTIITECRGATWTPSGSGMTGEVTFDYTAERCIRYTLPPSGGGSPTRREEIAPMHTGTERVPYAITRCTEDPLSRTCSVRLMAGRFSNLES